MIIYSRHVGLYVIVMVTLNFYIGLYCFVDKYLDDI